MLYFRSLRRENAQQAEYPPETHLSIFVAMCRDIPQIVAIVSVAIGAFDELAFDKCETPLGLWLVIYAILLVLSLSISVTIFRKLTSLGIHFNQAWLQYVLNLKTNEINREAAHSMILPATFVPSVTGFLATLR